MNPDVDLRRIRGENESFEVLQSAGERPNHLALSFQRGSAARR